MLRYATIGEYLIDSNMNAINIGQSAKDVHSKFISELVHKTIFAEIKFELPWSFSLTIVCHFGNRAKLIAIDLAVTEDSIAPPLKYIYIHTSAKPWYASCIRYAYPISE